jgi:SSS family solute:Na+ symporter
VEYLNIVMTAILLLELLYTVLGGMVSVVITDFIQFAALSLGTVVVTGVCIYNAGWQKMHDAVWSGMGPSGFNPIVSPYFGWAYIGFQVLLWMGVNTCWQTTAMRTFSTRDAEVSRRVFTWTGMIFLGRGMLPMLWGIAALAMLGPGHNAMEAMPQLLSRILPAGLRGIVVAGMLAATMSVNSSYLLGWSSVIAQDIVGPLRREPLGARSQVRLNRATNLAVSLFVMFWGLWYKLPGPAYFYLSMTATIFLGGAFAGIVGGLYWKRANVAGGYAAMLGGAAGSLAFFFLGWPASWAGFGAFVLAFAGLVVGSLLGRPNPAVPAAPAPVRTA